MERRARRCNQANLPLIFVHIDANMFRGWSPVCGTDRVDPVWSSMFPCQGDRPLDLYSCRAEHQAKASCGNYDRAYAGCTARCGYPMSYGLTCRVVVRGRGRNGLQG
jgi:hypothetical protein